MRFYKIVALSMVVLWGCNAYAAGLSTKVDHSKILQDMHDKENKELRKLKRNRHERINWDEELNLNDAQKKIVEDIIKNSREKIDEQMDIIKDAHKKIEEIHQEDDNKIRQILNPQQQIKFDKVKRKIQRSRGEKNPDDKPSRKKMRQY